MSAKPLVDALAGAKMRMLVALGTVVLCTVLTYTTLFMPGFAIRQLGLPQAGSFLATVLTGAIQIVLVPIFGAMSDRHGRLPIMIVAASIVLVVSYPMFAWLATVPTLQTLLIVQAIMGALGAAYMGPLAALMSDIFPTRMRTTGLAVSYSFCVAIFGGFAPFINAWLISGTGSQCRAELLSDVRCGDQPHRTRDAASAPSLSPSLGFGTRFHIPSLYFIMRRSSESVKSLSTA